MKKFGGAQEDVDKEGLKSTGKDRSINVKGDSSDNDNSEGRLIGIGLNDDGTIDDQDTEY